MDFLKGGNMKKRSIPAILLVLLIALSLVVFASCDKDGTKPDDVDGNYTLVLKGLVDSNGTKLGDIIIKKSQILQLYKTKGVEYTADNPATASDKTDEDGNPVKHTLKGVYLEDLVKEFSNSMDMYEYGSISLMASDGYIAITTEDVFNPEKHGSKVIVVFEFDGREMKEKSETGALRIVIPGQIASTWVKYLNVIEFSAEILAAPTAFSFDVLEAIDVEKYGGGFTATKDDGTYNYTGLSLGKIIGEGGLFTNIQETDKMCVIAWDYRSESNTFQEYRAWTTHAYYKNGYIVTGGTKAGDESYKVTRLPIVDGPDYSAAMTVKRALAILCFRNSIVSLDTAMKRYDPDVNGKTDGVFALKELLVLLNMYGQDKVYQITTKDGSKVELSRDNATKATISKNDASEYVLHVGKNDYAGFKGINIII